MFKPIARVNTDTDYAVELGYEVPEVITQDTKMEVSTRIVLVNQEKTEVDPESIEYKQAMSVSDVLKIGFEIGCTYTTKVIEQVNKMGDTLINGEEGIPANANVTGETSSLIVEE